MDAFINFFIKQKKLAVVFTLSIVVIGLLVAFNIQRDRFPNVDLETIIISAAYDGNSPEDVELGITNLIEDELKDISGIKDYTSVSKEGFMRIIVRIEPDSADIKVVKQSIRDGVNRVKDLPSDLKNLPTVIDAQPTHGTILQINLVDKQASYEQMRQLINYLEKELGNTDGVSRVNKSGYLDKEITIYTNPAKLQQYKIPLSKVIQAINNRNDRYTAGQNTSTFDERNFVVLSKFNQPKEVLEVVVSSSFDGPEIKLKDIATIVVGNEKEHSITRVNGKKGFILRVKKQESADIINTVALVKAKMALLQSNLSKSLEVFYTDDASYLVRNRLSIVTNNGLIGLMLILVVLSIFLSSRVAFWVALSLPVVIFGMVILLKISGETINLVSLAAIILVLGLVVDDSIIIAESIHHYRQKISDRYQAALFGFKRVINPILVTMLTTVMAFSAMFLMTGTLGKFIYVMPIVVIFALAISLFEVVIALPAHLAGVKMGVERVWFGVFEDMFETLSRYFLRFRYWVVVIFMLIFMFSVWLGMGMKFALFPDIGTDKINAKIELNAGASLLATEQKVAQLEQLISKVVGDDLDSVSAEIGSRFNHIARLEIALKPAAGRKHSGRKIHTLLTNAAKSIKDVAKIRFFIRNPGPPVGDDIEINLISADDTQRRQAADELTKILKNNASVSSLDRDDERGKGRLEVVLDYQAVGRLKLSLPIIRQYLQSSLNGIFASNYREGQDDVAFRIYLDNNKKIETLKIPNQNGLLIPIKQFAQFRKIIGESNYNHYNGQRSVAISASVDEDKTSADTVIKKALDKLNLAKNYPQVRSVLTGGSDESKKSVQSFGKAFALSIIGIYLLLMLLFDSYTQPLMVISTIPLSIIGVIIAFFLHGYPISFFTILGTLALVGVIVNDALILVNHLNFLAKEQTAKQTLKSRIFWIAKGAKQRLRAVVLTTLTTLAGVLPLGYGIGGIDYILQPMALALGYGLVFGTTMTLILMPALYLINLEIRDFSTRLLTKKPRLT